MPGSRSNEKSSIGAARNRFYFQILTTPTSDTQGTTVLLHFDNKRYLFGNISEGTQRAFTQRGVGFRKIRNIFLTGTTSWTNSGGLIGIILSAADVQASENDRYEPEEKPRIDIYGAAKLMHTVASARRFVFRKGVPITVSEFENDLEKPVEEPNWTDENVRVWAMPVSGNSSMQDLGYDSDSFESSPTASPKSPGKRSLDDFREDGEEPWLSRLRPEDQEVRRQVIREMFESEWAFDNLVEVRLKDVKQPAAMFVRDQKHHRLTPYTLPTPGDPAPEPSFKVLVRTPWPAVLRRTLPPARTTGPLPTMCYVIRGHPQRGVFDTKKALQLGVPKGPSFGRLAAGESLELDNGRIVTPEMVLGPKKPGKGIAIIDLPSVDYVQSLVNRPELKSQEVMDGVEAVCWILGPGVVMDHRLQGFIKSMPQIEHIISSKDVCPNYLAMDSSAASAIRLSRISKDIFPIPVHNNLTLPQDSTSAYPEELRDLFQPAQRGLTIQVEPKYKIEEDETASYLDTAKVITDIPTEVHQLARMAREKIAQSSAPKISVTSGSFPSSLTPTYADHEVITLGTGSALPSKYRNVSATLLRIPGYGNYLFDCGENTLGQLSRIFEPAELDDVLRNLRLVWISHLHADHHLGTMGVLLRRNAVCEADKKLKNKSTQPLFVASEEQMKMFLADYGSVEKVKDLRTLVCHPRTGVTQNGRPFNLQREIKGIRSIRTCALSHCYGAQAISITFENGFKFSYSGDCRPSTDFATIGRGSDVLVHEATFDNGLEGDAIAKKHCTTSEALWVASKMEAKNVILTHFSQRYQKLPNMSNVKIADTPNAMEEMDPAHESLLPVEDPAGEATQDDGVMQEDPDVAVETAPSKQELGKGLSLQEMNICVAFDYMRVLVGDIKHMQEFTPALKALFDLQHPDIAEAGYTEQEKTEMINRKQQARKADVLAEHRVPSRPGKRERIMEAAARKDENLEKRKRSYNDWINSAENQAQRSAEANLAP